MKIMNVKIAGIKCDNPDCDYVNMTIKLKDYKKYVNKPCPKCGCPLLTPDDFNTIQDTLKLSKAMNRVGRLVPKRLAGDLKETVKREFVMDGSGRLQMKDDDTENLEESPDIPEKSLNKARKNLAEMFETIFWVIYNDDPDIDDIETKMIESGLANEENYSVIFDSISKYVEDFKKIESSSHSESTYFARNLMNNLVKKMEIAYPELIRNQIEFS